MHWNINEKVLKQHIELLAHFRNLCAHDERIYCSKSETKLSDSNIHKNMNIPKMNDGTYVCGKDDLFALLITFKILLSTDTFNTIFNKLNGRIISLSHNLKCISIEAVLFAMGFPPNWRDIKNL